MTKVKLARLEGQSSDTKPVKYAGHDIGVGAKYHELDTDRNYEFDGIKWNEKTQGDEGKNFFAKQPRSSLIQLFGDTFAKVGANAVFLLEDLSDKQGGTGLTNVGEIKLNRIEPQLPLRGYKVPTFNGTTQELFIPTEAKIELGTDSFIIALSFATTALGTAQKISAYGLSAGTNPHWQIETDADNLLSVELQSTGGAVKFTDTKKGFYNDGKLHRVLVFADRTADLMYTFADGILLDTTDISLISGDTLTDAGEELAIGSQPNNPHSTFFTGEISNFQLYKDADPDNLFSLIPILSNPQLRESAGKTTDFQISVETVARLTNVMNFSDQDLDYVSTLINTSEGIYDLIELYKTNSNNGIHELFIDGILISTSDRYSGSQVNNVKKITNGIFLSGGTHILKSRVNGKNPSASALNINNNMFELIKRDGEYNESDEATHGVLFGDELLEKETMAGTLANNTSKIYNSEYNDGTVSAGEFIEGTIFIKKGLYKITFMADAETTFPTFSLIMGGVKVFDNSTDYDTAGSINFSITKFAFLEGGKTPVKFLIDSTSTGTEFDFTQLRFELVDGKGNGDTVNIFAGDQDFETVSGVATTTTVSTGVRWNVYRLNGTDALNDEVLYSRYFSGGTYLLKHVYRQTGGGGITDILLNQDTANPLLDGLDQHGGTSPNLEAFALVNIPRGFHDISIFNQAEGDDTGDFSLQFQRTLFTKIAENPQDGDDNSDGVHGSQVLLATNIVKLNNSGITFEFAPLDMFKRWSKLIVKVKGRPDSASLTQMKINGIATNYFVDGWEVVTSGTLVVKDMNAQTELELLSNSASVLDTECTINYAKDNVAVQEMAGNNHGGSSTPEAVGYHWIVTAVGTDKISSIEIISTNDFEDGTVMEVYGVLK